MKIEEYAIKAMEALIRYGKMPMSDTKGVADTAWEVAKRMKELEQQVKNCDLADVGGALHNNKTCKLINDNSDEFYACDVTDCCNVGPITRENYCPNCGANIERQ